VAGRPRSHQTRACRAEADAHSRQQSPWRPTGRATSMPTYRGSRCWPRPTFPACSRPRCRANHRSMVPPGRPGRPDSWQGVRASRFDSRCAMTRWPRVEATNAPSRENGRCPMTGRRPPPWPLRDPPQTAQRASRGSAPRRSQGSTRPSAGSGASSDACQVGGNLATRSASSL